MIPIAACMCGDVQNNRSGGMDQSALEGLIGYQLRRASNAIALDFTDALGVEALGEAAVRQVPFAIVALVASNPGITQGAIGRTLGIKPANMVTLIGELVDQRILDRRVSEGDRRALALSLTPLGHVRFADWRVRIRDHEARFFARLTPDEQSQLLALLKKATASRAARRS